MVVERMLWGGGGRNVKPKALRLTYVFVCLNISYPYVGSIFLNGSPALTKLKLLANLPPWSGWIVVFSLSVRSTVQYHASESYVNLYWNFNNTYLALTLLWGSTLIRMFKYIPHLTSCASRIMENIAPPPPTFCLLNSHV